MQDRNTVTANCNPCNVMMASINDIPRTCLLFLIHSVHGKVTMVPRDHYDYSEMLVKHLSLD